MRTTGAPLPWGLGRGQGVAAPALSGKYPSVRFRSVCKPGPRDLGGYLLGQQDRMGPRYAPTVPQHLPLHKRRHQGHLQEKRSVTGAQIDTVSCTASRSTKVCHQLVIEHHFIPLCSALCCK